MVTFFIEHWLDIVTTVLGLVYIWLEYRASIALWIVGIIMPALDIYLYWSHGLYADSGMAVYYTIAAIYGYAVWKFGKKRGQKDKEELPITHFRLNLILPTLIVFTVAWFAIYWVLVNFTNSNVPVTDSFINAFSFVGLWALARKYLEQWIVWIVVDAFCTVLYAYKGIPFKAGLYALYVVIAVMGYFKWKRMMENDKDFDAVILGAGEYPSHPVPLAVLSSARFVCCCDSAAVEYIKRGGHPDAIVGDGDSLPQEMKERYKGIWHEESEQEDNDLTKATRYCLSFGKRRIAYIGATGRREDHTLGNISLMANYMERFGIAPAMFTDYGYFIPVHGCAHLSTKKGQQVSVFNISSSRISSTGLKWDTFPFKEWWQGTLNEALGDSVEIECDGSVFVYLTYDIKRQP